MAERPSDRGAEAPLNLQELIPEHFGRFFEFFRPGHTGGIVPARIKELARLKVASINECDTWLFARYASATREGLDEETIAEIHKPEPERRLAPREALAVRLAEKLATDHRSAGPAFVGELRGEFSDAEIAELGLMVHQYIALGRLLHLAGGDKLACEIYVPDAWEGSCVSEATDTGSVRSAGARPSLAQYAVVGAIVAGAVAVTVWVVRAAEPGTAPPPAEALIPPVVVLVGLTGLVLLLAAIVRNLAIARGRASLRYYRDYVSEPPSERLERPARAFNNLMQVPTLFYVACLTMLATDWVDRAQLTLAWLFVGARAVHAAIYLLWNEVAYRFAAFAASVIVLAALWLRLATQHWPA